MTFTDAELLGDAPSIVPATVEHAPGIYFGMPDDEYHADPALGSTSIKAIAVDPIEWQFDRLNGEDRDTDAMIFGRAIHARMLEGIEAMTAKFCLGFDKTSCEGALDTMADLKAFLSEHGQSGFTSRKKEDLIKLVLEIDPDVKIAQVLESEWRTANEGKVELKPKRWKQVEAAARWVQRDPLLSAVMKDGTFVEGAPEVSIFYEDRGVRLKARIDRLMRHAKVDIKTFAPMFDGEIHETSLKTIQRMRYHWQAADYERAWEFAKPLHQAGNVFGTEPLPGFLDECFSCESPLWIWIMVKSKGAPQPLVIEWDAIFAKRSARDRVDSAINRYIELRDKFGDDQEWVPMHPAWKITDTDLPTYFE